MKKKVFTILLAMTMLFSSSTLASAYESETEPMPQASEDDSYDLVAAKHMLMARAHAEHANRARTASNLSEEETNEILLKMGCGLIEDSESVRQTLEDSGVYILNTPVVDEPALHISPDASCVSMSCPIVSYNEYTGNWSVTGGGYYTDTSWISKTAFYPQEDVGGYDAYGVSFTNVKGTYTASIVKQYAFINDGVGTEKTSNSRSYGGDKSGFGFQFQDYSWRETDRTRLGHDYYVGKHFATQIVYSSDFANFSGTATSFHFHTYDKAQLKSVSLSTSSGVSATIDFSESSFKALSSEVRF